MERNERFFTSRIMPMLLFFTVTAIPQTVLILMNWHYYSIIADEVKEYSGTIGSFFTGELMMIAGMIAMTFALGTGRRIAGLIVPALTLLMSAAYLWLFTSNYSRLIQSVPSWIVSKEHLLYYQYVLVMPSAIYSIISFALYRIGEFSRRKVIVLGSCVIGIPVSWFIGVYAVLRFLRGGTVDAIMYPLLIMLLASTVVLYVLVFRLFVIVWRKIDNRWEKRIRLALGVIFGLAAPVGGLIFNMFVPFPADFQYWQIYALAVVNGIVIVFPVTKRPAADRVISALRVVMYPFTVYFFIVFIPFVPLSIPAIIAAGVGFLVLTPSFLLALHSLAIIDDMKSGRAPFNGRKAALAALLLVIPAVFVGRALVDRYTLISALDYVYEPDHLRDLSFGGSRMMLKNSIGNMIRFKNGDTLPFLSGIYDSIVFDNLVLPDAKIAELVRIFFSKEDFTGLTDNRRYSIFGIGSGRRVNLDEFQSEPVPADSTYVVMTKTEVKRIGSSDGFVRTRVSMDMTNTAKTQEEFRARIALNDGVFISGFALEVDGAPVKGRIFGRKTALWVYEMIVSTRRDPGVLYYTADNELMLRVFPFAGGETRHVDVEFMYPAYSSPEISVAGRKIFLPRDKGEGSMIAHEKSGRGAVFIPASVASGMSSVRRKELPHLLVDVSAANKAGETELCGSIRGVLARFPSAEEFSLTVADYDIVDCAERVPADRIIQVFGKFMSENRNSRKGGFAGNRALKHVLLKSGALNDRYPSVVVVTPDRGTLKGDDMSYFARFIPDTDGYMVTGDGVRFESVTFSGKSVPALRRFPVREVQTGSGVRAFFRADLADHLLAYERDAGIPHGKGGVAYVMSGGVDAADSADNETVESAFDSFAYQIRAVRNPSLFRDGAAELVEAGRKTGILNAATSYIVVESPMQWKVLEEKDLKKLNANNQMEHSEPVRSPEPSSIIVCALAGAIAGIALLIRRKRGISGADR